MARTQIDYNTDIKNLPPTGLVARTFLTSYTGNDLAVAVADIGSTVQTLVINAQPALITADLTIPSNISLIWDSGSLADGLHTLTIEGDITAGHYQLFGNNITVVLKNNNCSAHWFSGGDLGDQINTAVNSLYQGGGIEVAPGDYDVTTPIVITGGIRLYTETPGGDTDLDWGKTPGTRLVYTGTTPMISLNKGTAAEGSSQIIEGFTLTTSRVGTASTEWTKACIQTDEGTRKVLITNCQFWYWGAAINLNANSTSSGQVSHILRNTIRRCVRGIYLDGADHSIIAYNRLIDCTVAWVEVGDAGTYSVWIDHNNCANSSSDYGDGIIIRRGTPVNITYNHFETHVAAPGSYCIKLLGDLYSGTVNVAGNFINFSGQSYGVRLLGNIRNLNFTGNEFHGDETVTISAINNGSGILGTLYNATAIGNMLYGCTTKPLVNNDSGFILLDNGGYSSNKGYQILKFDKRSAAPDTPEDGQVYYADGTNWDPGSGEGLYCRVAGAYVKL